MINLDAMTDAELGAFVRAALTRQQLAKISAGPAPKPERPKPTHRESLSAAEFIDDRGLLRLPDEDLKQILKAKAKKERRADEERQVNGVMSVLGVSRTEAKRLLKEGQ